MEQEVKEVTINGVDYVRKDSVKETQEIDGDWVIVRTYSAGVFFGKISSREGKECVMSTARRLWYWDGAPCLQSLAMDGTSKPQNCKFPCTVANLTLTEVIEITPCSAKGVKSIQGVKVWEQ